MKDILQDDIIKIHDLSSELFPEKKVESIERLGGLTNHTYKVCMEKTGYVFRLPGEGTENLINRKEEKISTELAVRVGVDADLIYFEDKTGIKVSYYLEGADTMSPEKMHNKDNIALVAGVLKKIHNCGEDTGIMFDVFVNAANYEKFIIDNHIMLHEDYGYIYNRVMLIKKMLGLGNIVPSHNDPLCENWMKDHGNPPKMYLIDWEYAGMNDEMWDLADVAIEAGLEEKDEILLLSNYYGREPSKAERVRFAANKVYIDFLWYLWGKTRVPFDGGEMEEYAAIRYIRLKENLSKWGKV